MCACSFGLLLTSSISEHLPCSQPHLRKAASRDPWSSHSEPSPHSYHSANGLWPGLTHTGSLEQGEAGVGQHVRPVSSPPSSPMVTTAAALWQPPTFSSLSFLSFYPFSKPTLLLWHKAFIFLQNLFPLLLIVSCVRIRHRTSLLIWLSLPIQFSQKYG